MRNSDISVLLCTDNKPTFPGELRVGAERQVANTASGIQSSVSGTAQSHCDEQDGSTRKNGNNTLTPATFLKLTILT